jgi:hypothetical protein
VGGGEEGREYLVRRGGSRGAWTRYAVTAV